MFIPSPVSGFFSHPGSGFRIPDPGVKKATNPDPEHWFMVFVLPGYVPTVAKCWLWRGGGRERSGIVGHLVMNLIENTGPSLVRTIYVSIVSDLNRDSSLRKE